MFARVTTYELSEGQASESSTYEFEVGVHRGAFDVERSAVDETTNA